jgi:hypothetical protein
MHHPFRHLVLGLGFSLVGASSVWAMGSPPLITDDPGTPEKGHWEINIGASTISRPDAQSSELPLFDINYGLTSNIQLKYEIPYVVQNVDGEGHATGWGNSAFGIKWRFYDGGEQGYKISIYPQYEFNNPGSHSDERGLVEPGSAFVLPIQLEKEIGFATLNLQLGREFRSEENSDSWIYGVALSREVSPKVELGVELAGTAAPELDRSVLVLNLGMSVEMSEKTSFMISVGRELHNHEDSRATFIGYVGLQFRL